jgi:hypothetical protein
MRAEDLVFWLDRLADDADADTAVLCRRHADSMVVPRGWTLDDLRDPDLHLFRPPLPAPAPPDPAPRTRSPRRGRDLRAGEQLRLGADQDPPAAAGGTWVEDTAGTGEGDVEPATPIAEGVDPGPWSPTFDEADDLDGLLSARSPLLSRAFRTADRADG